MKLAVIEDSVVTNIIVAESVEIAEEVTGMTCVEFNDENPAIVGAVLTEDGSFEYEVVEGIPIEE